MANKQPASSFSILSAFFPRGEEFFSERRSRLSPVASVNVCLEEKRTTNELNRHCETVAIFSHLWRRFLFPFPIPSRPTTYLNVIAFGSNISPLLRVKTGTESNHWRSYALFIRMTLRPMLFDLCRVKVVFRSVHAQFAHASSECIIAKQSHAYLCRRFKYKPRKSHLFIVGQVSKTSVISLLLYTCTCIVINYKFSWMPCRILVYLT